MLFKRKIFVDEYLTTRLDLLFSSEQAESWLEIKRSCGDSVLLDLKDDLYLTHLRAAHIELLSMVLTKKYPRDADILFEFSTFIEDYLAARNHVATRELMSLYNQALGSSAIDGIFVMAKAMMDSLCKGQCSQETLLGVREMFYAAVGDFRADFKKVKLSANYQE